MALIMSACGSEVVVAGDPAPPEKGVTMRPSHSASAEIACGASFAAPTPSAITLRAVFPPGVNRTATNVAGSVQATSTAEPVTGVISGPEAFLVRDGAIVTVPVPQDSVGHQLRLDVGGTVTLSAQATLLQCDSGSGQTPQPVPTGRYELYVRLVISHADGSSTESIGGPAPLIVR